MSTREVPALHRRLRLNQGSLPSTHKKIRVRGMPRPNALLEPLIPLFVLQSLLLADSVDQLPHSS